MHRVIHMCLMSVFGVVFAQLKTKNPVDKRVFGLASRPVTADSQLTPPAPVDPLLIQVLSHSDLIVCGGKAVYDVVTGTAAVMAQKHLEVTGAVVVFEHMNNSIGLNLYMCSVCGELYKAFGSVHTDSSVVYCI